ncbi:MAG: acyl-CoA reductase [Bacteroidota bacterium]|nr:acyl-CoA reductase [Bacteroidota bacterium]
MKKKIIAISKLGKCIAEPEAHDDIMQDILRAEQENPWFTKSFCIQTLTYWGKLLSLDNLSEFAKNYSFGKPDIKRVGIIMAGNIPIVGMHDLLMVILSGHKAIVKRSSKDMVLPKMIIRKLSEFMPEIHEQVIFETELFKNTDAIIATGSNNSARYFEQYFEKLPHIIRKNRNAIAVLSGKETPAQLNALCDDIFMYFGLGCRSVSKLYVPEDYDVTKILDACESWSHLMEHSKYMNNYIYQKAILLMDLQVHLDNDFLLLREQSDLASPLSVLHYERYKSIDSLQSELSLLSDSIQCISSDMEGIPERIPLGTCQKPGLDTFADNVDSMEFLLNL